MLSMEGRQNIFSTIFDTKFVVICATKILKIGYEIKILCPNFIFKKGFCIGKGDNPGS